MGRIVIAAYRPKPGHEDALCALVAGHVARLRAEGLVTERAPIAGRAGDGTVVEVFEWASAEAIQRAHENPRVLAMWEEFGAVCDFVPIGQLPEASQLFSELTPLDA